MRVSCGCAGSVLSSRLRRGHGDLSLHPRPPPVSSLLRSPFLRPPPTRQLRPQQRPLPQAIKLMTFESSAPSSETYAVDVEVKDASNITCLYAKWMMNFSITYESNISEYKNIAFMLPQNVNYDGSSCGDETSGPQLSVEFGTGNIWSINFTKTHDTYQGNITFIYNTDDVELFPDAKRKGPIITSAYYPVHPVQLNTVFTCRQVDSVQAGNVTNDFWNISLQAFLQNGSLSTKHTHCDKDAAASLLSTDTTTGHWLINIDPNSTVATGKCGERTADLRLNDNNNTIIDFLFAIKNTSSDKFYLKGVNITLVRPANGSLFAANNNLSSWEASLGSSYMCRKEETLVVTEGYRIMTFDLRVEPFNVKENKFSTAQECSLDDDTILIPIAVGTALVILIVFIVLAYVIGRRKGYAGYQTL
uniref:Uncharacterized protein n=1 Tax=Sphaerodactylus townsendi TaxID=933632 RepID=A0ACB8FXH7_9SAUR